MANQIPPTPTWAVRLQQIDRRILYLILVFAVGIPTLFPVNIPNAILPMSRGLWETIEKTPSDKIVLVSSAWSLSTAGESQGQYEAVLTHLMKRKIKFAVSSFTPQGSQVSQDVTKKLAEKLGYKYGDDWVHLGYQASPNNFVKGISADFSKVVKQDAILKKPMSEIPMMKNVKSVDDVHIVVEFSASDTTVYWIDFLKTGVLVGTCPTSVMAPEALPYQASGQLVGLLWGAKGAYDYEQLNIEAKITSEYGRGKMYMGPLSAAFLLIILSIVVGNVSMYLAKRQAKAG